jgi:outer membrane protein assembly factor BamB
MADGKIYAFSGEHTPSEPITRGWSLYCVNATDGSLIWKIEGPMSVGTVADGYLTASNTYDGYTYVFGKGLSQTTVITAPAIGGSAVLIKGTVMDNSPGDQSSFINPTAPLDSPTKPGTVPYVSAASMGTQMEYLYEQQPIDGIWHNETLTGVPVTLTAIGSDGSVIDLGKVTTNEYYGTTASHGLQQNRTYTLYPQVSREMAPTAVHQQQPPLSVGAAPTITPTSTPTTP